MKKFVKLSLVAAVAVAGLTTANAKPLEEAIKGVDVTGTVAYRYQETNTTAGTNASNNMYNAAMDVTVPAGDDLAMGLSFQAGVGTLNTSTAASTGLNVQLTGANFTYSGLTNTTITAGLQAIPTPWTVAADAMGTTHAGTGVLAVSTWSPVTLVGAYFNQTDISTNGAVGSTDIYVLGAVANFAGVSLEAMYADMSKVLDSYTVAAGYKFEVEGVKVALEARHTNLQLDGVATDNELTYGKIKVAAGMFDAYVGYGETGKNGGTVAFDGTAKTTMEGFTVHLYSATANGDRDYTQASIGAQVLPSTHVSVNYNKLDTTTAATDADETYLQVKYSASKALSTYVRLGENKVGTLKSDTGRLHVQYSF